MTPQKLAVLGDPVAQSLSPRLHGFWIAQEDRAASYEARHVPEGMLADAVAQLRAEGFMGCNLTIPHKEAALVLCDEIDEAARAMGAVNTLHFVGDKVIGKNTDAYGFMASLSAQAPNTSLAHVVVLGAGGAARAVVFGLLQAGAKQITLLNRTAERAQQLAKDFMDARVQVGVWERASDALETATLLVNTTSLGMSGQPPLSLDISMLHHDAVVADIVYKPLHTDLLRAASMLGLRTVDGLGMLLFQAQAAYETWFGARLEVSDALRAHLLEALEA